MNVADAALAVHAALKTVPGLRAHTDMGAPVDPPASIVGPPALTWSGHGDGPNLARFVVYVVMAADERALETLWELVPAVVAALENYPGADITVRPGEDQAVPGRWPAGAADLPAYEITCEVTL